MNQTYRDFELIILDDASTDNSVDIISEYVKKFPDLISYAPNNQNSGSPYKQWHKGMELAKGDFIWIAESDDLASLNFLEELVPLLENNKNVAIVCAKSNAIDTDGVELSSFHPVFRGFETILFKPKENTYTYFEGKPFIESILVNRCLIPNVSGTLIRKASYFRIGGINTSFKRSGDYDMYFRLLEKEAIIYSVKWLNSTRYHDSKLTAKNTIVSFHERYIILKRIFNMYSIQPKTKEKSGNFYFTVFKYDIFLNDGITFINKMKCFRELVDLYPHLYRPFGNFLFSRFKISLSKKSNG